MCRIQGVVVALLRVTVVAFLLQSDEELVQQAKKEKQEFATVQSKLKILEVYVQGHYLLHISFSSLKFM